MVIKLLKWQNKKYDKSKQVHLLNMLGKLVLSSKKWKKLSTILKMALISHNEQKVIL